MKVLGGRKGRLSTEEEQTSALNTAPLPGVSPGITSLSLHLRTQGVHNGTNAPVVA